MAQYYRTSVMYEDMVNPSTGVVTARIPVFLRTISNAVYLMDGTTLTSKLTSIDSKVSTLEGIDNIYTYNTEAAYLSALNAGTVPAKALAVVRDS